MRSGSKKAKHWTLKTLIFYQPIKSLKFKSQFSSKFRPLGQRKCVRYSWEVPLGGECFLCHQPAPQLAFLYQPAPQLCDKEVYFSVEDWSSASHFINKQKYNQSNSWINQKRWKNKLAKNNYQILFLFVSCQKLPKLICNKLVMYNRYVDLFLSNSWLLYVWLSVHIMPGLPLPLLTASQTAKHFLEFIFMMFSLFLHCFSDVWNLCFQSSPH